MKVSFHYRHMGTIDISFQNSCSRRNMSRHWKANQKEWCPGPGWAEVPCSSQVMSKYHFLIIFMGNTCLTPLLLLPFYLLVSKIMCSNKGIGFVFVKDESVITIKNRLTHHPHSLASFFYKEERNKHLHLNSRAPWK